MPLLAFLLAPTSLAVFLKSHPPEGPWLAVGAESVTAEAPADLVAFDRKAVKVGGLTAVVPRTRIEILDPAKAKPNLTDGLPRSTKLLALLAGLDSSQWRALGGTGLGLSDLRTDQRAIFASILPAPFQWDDYRDGKTRRTLPETERTKVRLRLNRRVVYALGSGANPNSYHYADAGTGIDAKPPTSGNIAEDDSRYGVLLRTSVPNAPKPGALPNASLNAGIVLAGNETVGALLGTISRASGKEILADRRVAGLSITAKPGRYRAGDLTQALALAVGGTYRTVGSAFALVGDLEGARSRRERLLTWNSGLRSEAFQHQTEWQKAVAANGGMRSVGYSASDPTAPPSDFAETMVEMGVRPTLGPSSTLPKGMQKDLEGMRSSIPGLNWDPNRVAAMYSVEAVFVLPDGATVGVGRLPSAPPTNPELAPGARFIIPRDAPPRPVPTGARLIVPAESPAEADAAIELAKTFGFGELWLETHETRALSRAIETAGIPVRLAVRPWTALIGQRVADPDRTSTGFAASTVPDASSAGRELRPPFDSTITSLQEKIAALAKIPRLAGVTILDETPPGYTGAAPSRLTPNEPDFGYSGNLRLAFFRANGIDPVDIAEGWLELTQSLYRPFFAYGPGLNSPTSEERQAFRKDDAAWMEFRKTENERRLKAFLDGLGNVPILVQGRRGDPRLLNSPPLLPYVAGAPLPVFTGIFVRTDVSLVRLAGGDEGALRARLRQGGWALDLGDIPTAKRQGFLDRIVKRHGNP